MCWLPVAAACAQQRDPPGSTGAAGPPSGHRGRAVDLFVSTTAGGRASGDSYELHLGLAWPLARRWSLHVNGFAGAALKDDRSSLGVVGADNLLRWHYASWSEAVLHLDLGLGFQWAADSFPDDSRHNFRSQVGLGLTRPLSAGRRLLVGTCFMHVSNARTSRDNAGLNTAIVYAGLSWPR